MTKINAEIEALKQAFKDGCEKIVGKLTALNYPPAEPKGPDEINEQIQRIYDDRYTKGYEDGLANSPNNDLRIVKKYHNAHKTPNGGESTSNTRSTKGGCYTVSYHSHTSSCYESYTTTELVCIGSCDCTHDASIGLCGCGHGNHSSNRCGAPIYENKTVTKTRLKCGNRPITGYKPGCGLALGAIESFTVYYGNQSEEVVV